MTTARALQPSVRSFGVVNAVLSLAVVSFLFWLLYFRGGSPGSAAATSTVLPALNAVLNGTSAVLIIVGRIAIRQRKRRLHATLMIAAVACSACFVTSYIYYHLHHGDTLYTGTGWIRPVYFTILISHVLTSIIAFPMILTSLFLAWSGRLVTHRRVSQVTWIAWLYVSVTGVAVYFFLY